MLFASFFFQSLQSNRKKVNIECIYCFYLLFSLIDTKMSVQSKNVGNFRMEAKPNCAIILFRPNFNLVMNSLVYQLNIVRLESNYILLGNTFNMIKRL